MRRFLVAGNWKMNTVRQSATALSGELAAVAATDEAGVEVLVCPPYPYLLPVGDVLRGSAVRLGAQDVYFESPGAFTGEVAVEMLRDVGCQYVLIGHSERRAILGETDAVINRKVRAAIVGGLTVVLCVGEQLSERQAGETEAVLDRQMEGAFAGISDSEASGIVIAYEPVWAIGTGVTASPEQAESAHEHLRKWLARRYNPNFSDKTRILYGGSVKPDNALALLGQPNVDGALVGGASLKAATFVPIIEAARKLSG
jgi:triosephosphate isomerase